MVTPIRVLLALSLGIMLYILIPILVMGAPPHMRKKVGSFYGKLGILIYEQACLLRRELSGYDLQQIKVDNEQKLLKTTLSSSMLGEDKEYRFTDPANRIKRLWNKPLSLNYEELSASVDPELAEWAHWFEQHDINEGTEEGGEVKPYMKASDGLYVSDPKDTMALVGKSASPTTIKTVEAFTRERLRKYGGGVGIKQMARVVGGFIAGAGVVYGGLYVKEELLGSGGSGGDVVGGEIFQMSIDLMVMLV